MILNLRSKLLKITDDLMKNPLNTFFTTRFDETIQTYKCDDQNMNKFLSLSTIETKINNKEYASSLEWYNDIISMYQNAINYSQNERIKNASQYLIESFKKNAYGTNFDSSQWNKEVIKLTSEINNLIEKSPIPQGIDPFIIGIVNSSVQAHQLSIQQCQWTINTINELCKNPDHLYDVFCILKLTKSDFDQTPHTISIDFDTLKPAVMNALFLYAISFQKDNFEQINQTEVVLDQPITSESQTNSQPQSIDQKPTEKIARSSSQNYKIQNDNLKVTPAAQRVNSTNQVQRNPPNLQVKDENQSIQPQNKSNSQITPNQIQLLHYKMQSQINQQNIQNLVNQLNQQNFQTQANQYDRLIRNNIQANQQNQQNQSNQSDQTGNTENPIIISTNQEKQNQQVQVDQASLQNQTPQIKEQSQKTQQVVQIQPDQSDQPTQIEISITPIISNTQNNQ